MTAPFLQQAFDLTPDRFAVMQEPEEQIRSWFRYRNRDTKLGSDASTDGMSFDEFVLVAISDVPPHLAGIGHRFNMLTSAKGEVLVHHLFAYEKPLLFQSFLSDRFGIEIALKQKSLAAGSCPA